MRNICSVDDCGLFVKGYGYCNKHYMRYRKYGDPHFALSREECGKMARKINIGPCSVDECDTPSRTRGMCPKHYLRWRVHGDSSVVLGNPHTKTCPSTISYSLAHEHVGKAKGRAADYTCEHCPAQAQDWAYNHQDPDERYSIRDPNKHHYGHVYSVNPDFYIPLCRKCHKALDGSFARSVA